MRDTYHVLVVGGGIVGLATALTLTQRYPGLRLAVLEKGDRVASHQTGHNSGVIHSGIYYRPGSLKARLCVEGARRMVAFCQEHGVAYELCGKLVVATDEREMAGLQELHRRGTANGVRGLRLLTRGQYHDIEPNAAGTGALHVSSTGIVDYKQAAAVMADLLQARGADVVLNAEVTGIVADGASNRVLTTRGDVGTRRLINCAGLYSDKVARLMGVRPDVQILPFRGEYYFLRPERASLVKGLIYPVPDPSLPFLGVHLTRMIHGGVEAGPNAVLALAREGYTRGTVNWRELGETLAYSGFRGIAKRWWRTGLFEYYRSLSKRAFARSLQKLVPSVSVADLSPGGAGVRAQAVTVDGRMVDDFSIVVGANAVHVLNAPSPAATASLAIGEYIADRAAEAFALT